MKRIFVTATLKAEMKRLEAEGLTRKEIAGKLDVSPATVTKALGAVRQYRGARLAPIF